jgi:hypothetical protein
MRCTALALTLILALSLAEGYPLHGSNGAVNCTIFGAYKTPFTPGDVNAGKNMIYNVDIALVRANATDSSTVNAVYTLTDGNDKVYELRKDYTNDLQPGRLMLGFVVPKEAVIKSLTVDPLKLEDGDQFVIPFDELINSSNGKATLLYYGILSSKSEANRRAVEFDISVSNNDTSRLSLSSKNFTLIDQWGWRYSSQAFNKYSGEGFPVVELLPNQTIRSGVLFNYLSPISRPAMLAYEYNNTSSIVIDIDSEKGIRPSSSSNSGQCSNQPAAESPPPTLAGSIKATKSRLAKVRENLNSSSNSSA